ncbi:4-(cytidine 5'-diphospho)-2-C-methyl-D-erythritol kinase [soil metagenome]
MHILGRRADGYHELDSIAAFCDLADRLTFTPAPVFSLALSGPFAASVPAGADNLVMKAARRFAAAFPGFGAYAITLEKNLPAAAGLGGGSADAAATLRGLAQLAGYNDDLNAMATELGADVPVCLASRASRMRGKGERLEPLPQFAPLHAVLVNPGIPLATADVFRALALAPGGAAFAPLAEPVDIGSSRNDLTEPALRLVPAIAAVLGVLSAQKGVTLVRMSGSGPTCFALFDSQNEAAAAASAVTAHHPEWWVKMTVIG